MTIKQNINNFLNQNSFFSSMFKDKYRLQRADLPEGSILGSSLWVPEESKESPILAYYNAPAGDYVSFNPWAPPDYIGRVITEMTFGPLSLGLGYGEDIHPRPKKQIGTLCQKVRKTYSTFRFPGGKSRFGSTEFFLINIEDALSDELLIPSDYEAAFRRYGMIKTFEKELISINPPKTPIYMVTKKGHDIICISERSGKKVRLPDGEPQFNPRLVPTPSIS